ncbi:hypothetical protein CA951_32085 [Rhodococcus sp. NCIMB 12038]|nr:hypothetical protein CA951_32085 [Rhodococcus sp. NCIMB 12038]
MTVIPIPPYGLGGSAKVWTPWLVPIVLGPAGAAPPGANRNPLRSGATRRTLLRPARSIIPSERISARPRSYRPHRRHLIAVE